MCLHTYKSSWRYKLTVKWRIWERNLRKASTSFFALFSLVSWLSHSRKPFLSQSYAIFIYLADTLVLHPWTCALSPWLLARPMLLLSPGSARGSSFLHQTMTRRKKQVFGKNKLNRITFFQNSGSPLWSDVKCRKDSMNYQLQDL